MSEEKGIERRRFERKELNTELKYTILLPAFRKGITKNISQDGLCILIDQQLSKGSILRAEFDLLEDEGEKEHIEAMIKVMWQVRQGDKFLTGARFLI
jgi:hypothetical protein